MKKPTKKQIASWFCEPAYALEDLKYSKILYASKDHKYPVVVFDDGDEIYIQDGKENGDKNEPNLWFPVQCLLRDIYAAGLVVEILTKKDKKAVKKKLTKTRKKSTKKP